MWLPLMLGVCLSMIFVSEAGAFTAYISNERSNTVSVIDTNKWEVVRPSRSGSAHAASPSPRIRNTSSSLLETTTRSR